MPIEVRELVIKATVDPKGAPGGGEGRAAPGGAGLDEKTKRRLVAEAVAQTLDALDRRRER